MACSLTPKISANLLSCSPTDDALRSPSPFEGPNVGISKAAANWFGWDFLRIQTARRTRISLPYVVSAIDIDVLPKFELVAFSIHRRV
jgi:hypothetical protein